MGAAPVIQRCRDAVKRRDDKVVTELIELFGGDPGPDMVLNHLKYAGCGLAGGAHGGDV